MEGTHRLLFFGAVNLNILTLATTGHLELRPRSSQTWLEPGMVHSILVWGRVLIGIYCWHSESQHIDPGYYRIPCTGSSNKSDRLEPGMVYSPRPSQTWLEPGMVHSSLLFGRVLIGIYCWRSDSQHIDPGYYRIPCTVSLTFSELTKARHVHSSLSWGRVLIGIYCLGSESQHIDPGYYRIYCTASSTFSDLTRAMHGPQ